MALRKNTTYSSRGTYAARAAHARGDKQFRRYDTSSIMPQRKTGPIVFGVILVVVVLVVLFFVVSTVMNSCSAKNPNLVADGTQVNVTITEGEGGTTIAQDLYDAGLINSTKDFIDKVSQMGAGQSLKPGAYVLVGGTSVDDLVSTLTAGPGIGKTVTVPEGYTISSIASAVEQATGGAITASQFSDAAGNVDAYRADFSFIGDATSLEGFLFPKTYEIASDTTADSLIRAMLNQYSEETASLDYSYPESQGLNQYQALILASIVEKESDDSTRAQVAAVFYNRLNNFDDPNYGYLQSDATTAYEVGHDPTAEEVHADSDYSTYTHQGLPPTPICPPGIEALKAVCSPDSELLGNGYYYFYFAQGDDGKMEYTFSQTLDEHNAAIANDN